ncbi:SusC/RagA family TonB-linked outer membrane protein [Chitinophaga nivalis]|uniref:SusC/RagA family TonB-linked outer membrane protein n=1 Tax=Chitinophaga nivalis TaxID=2991709 RepID=A0ABT3IFQ9_9BACT|nr:SusC/RagA family TonB-linked outer membrane protein [Chitinophaga nivalis]MCW3467514.1 SusC/RagA family TonB-linked outer membrane protein [Chitinophaga nivalis]MCW3482794.1 SusC/RagA family TonB-linked outer membrane protein [Chitinophaga nivalis]
MKKHPGLTKVCAMAGLALTSILADHAYVKAAGYSNSSTTSFRSILQEKEISGTVRDNKGNPLPGVTVQVKGGSRGTQTNANGQYHITAKAGDVLIFTSVGFGSQEQTVGNSATLNARLEDNVKGLNELVVTALGIQRKAKDLTYSTQQVKGEDLTTVKESNVLNSLSGKVSGLQVNRSASGVGGSARVILRGQKSIRENQPLYVIDGVPIANFTSAQPSDLWGQASGASSGGRDGGDILSTINPDDIESINVLKGASASALYGSQAANGVIMISTKKGKVGQAKIVYSSNFTIDRPAYRPELQYDYKQSGPDEKYSWGPKGSSPDHVKNFFQTGTTWINSVNVSGGTEKAQTYFSYSNTTNKGIIPTSKFGQHTVNFRETAKFLNDKLSLDANVQMTTQKAYNRPTSGLYYNALTGLYLFPRGLDFEGYKNNYEYFSPSRNMYLQDWWNINAEKNLAGNDIQQNPYWILNRNITDNRKDNIIASLAVRYTLNDWLSIQARGNVNKSWDKYELKANAGTQTTIADKNGRYTYDFLSSTQYYGDVLLVGNKKLSDKIGFNFTAGTSITDLRQDRTFMDSKDADLAFANVFHIGNINLNTASKVTPTGQRRQLQSVFGTVGFNLSEKVFLDLTARNDWSSTLAFTPNLKKGYLYYSAGLNAILSDIVQLPKFVDYAKVRGSFARVGNDVAQFSTLPVNRITAGLLTSNTSGAYLGQTLKPEMTTSIEFGTEWRLLDNRLNFDITWYNSHTKDQYFDFAISSGYLYPNAFINAGNVQNTGIEASLGYQVIKQKDLTWQTNFNFTRNRNKIIELAPQLKGDYVITPRGNNVNNYALMLHEGSSFGDIYGREFQRADDGSIIVDDKGNPQSKPGKLSYLGNPTPKFLLGWSNTVTWKQLSLSVLIDGRFGGKVMSITQAMLDEFGVSKASADARENGGVDIPATKIGGGKFTGKIPAQTFYGGVGGRAGITEYYMYDATNIRLRELALTYAVPLRTNVIKDLKVGFVGRNLFFFTKKAPYDPELSMSTDNGVQGVDVFGLPATRSFGLNVKCAF